MDKVEEADQEAGEEDIVSRMLATMLLGQVGYSLDEYGKYITPRRRS